MHELGNVARALVASDSVTANRSSWWFDRRLVGLLMNERDQALLDCDRLKSDRQLPGINNQAVDFYQPGERAAGETARQRPIVIELANAQRFRTSFALLPPVLGAIPK